MKIRKGDKVKIIVGKDKNREGKVEKIYPKQNKILVLGVNIYRKHIKKSEKIPQGGVVELPRPIDVAKVMLICSKCGKVTKVGFVIKKNKKQRICKRCKSGI
jgi:large subunit ribosomal protein L24